MKFSFVRNYLVSSILIIALIFSYIYKIGDVEFYTDESQWIGSSQVFEEYFTAKFNSPYFDESYWTLTQPPLARYFIGLGRKLGGHTWGDINKTWNFALTAEQNAQRGAMPSPSLLWWSRLPMTILAIMSFSMLFSLIRNAAGVTSGYTWLLFGITNAYFLLHLRRAMGESILLFCIVLVLGLCYLILSLLMRQQTIDYWKTKLLILMASLGICIGAAGNAKLNGLSVGLIGLFLAIMIFIKYQATLSQKLSLGVISLFVVVACSSITFVGINPYLWPDPVARTQNMLNQRIHEMEEQQVKFSEEHIDSLTERLRVVPERIFSTYAPIMPRNGIIVNTFLFIVGLIFVIKNIYHYRLNTPAGIVSLSLLVVGFLVVFPALLTPLDWERYYLFPIFFEMIIISIGVGSLLSYLHQYFQNKTNIRNDI
ncbi:hypothetical protein [Candidatus Oscillochloris fontis]|uniref:hypothetical protein n=1 Tax=Candidatus Oscillochloris fontis TaxID=2496868 RepID=UPI00101D627C|nr:hypothetical protein [Candidatus Oscillochloris fontis]